MRRREFIAAVAGMAVLTPAWPRRSRAQQPERTRLIGVLMSWSATDQDAQRWMKAFIGKLDELGWSPGQNARIEIRWASSDRQHMHANAAEIVGLNPDVILTNTAPGLAALLDVSHTVPAVFTQIVDPVGGGFVPSLARPGGNLTGFTSFETATGAKWLELLKESVPLLNRAAVLLDPKAPGYTPLLLALKQAATALDIQLVESGVGNASDVVRSIDAFAAAPNGGLIAFPTPVVVANRAQVIELAARRRLPAVYPYRYFTEAGGLMSYGPDTIEIYRAAATYIDRVLKGARPADLPVQQPSKFELVVNLKTARTLGVELPPTLIARADAVIE